MSSATNTRTQSKILLLKKKIKNREYDSALALIKYYKSKNPDPRLRAFISKVEGRLVKSSENEFLEYSSESNSKSNAKSNVKFIALLSIFPVLLLMIAPFFLSDSVSNSRVESEWSAMCQNHVSDWLMSSGNYPYVSTYRSVYTEECNRQAEKNMRIHTDDMIHCYRESEQGRLPFVYERCVLINDIDVDTGLVELEIIISGE